MVNEDSGGVCRQDGSVIKGLYAAGRAAVGLPSHYYIGGLSHADCVFSGRRAGRSAACQIPTEPEAVERVSRIRG